MGAWADVAEGGGQEAGICECGNEPLGYTTRGSFLVLLWTC